MIEALFEAIFSFVLELALELVGEVLVELGFHSTVEKLSDKASNRILLGTAYTIFGAILGFVSLFVFPKIVFSSPMIPISYFLVSPVVAGFSLTTVSWVINRGIRPVSWFAFDKFAFGVVFALGYSLSRITFG
ncbi:MAG: hypothetical protein HOP17_09120 [Acidobacteria bacterium]|nr:hypothetical protein [Acidobacteriota bacterium]